MQTWENGAKNELPYGPWSSEPDKMHWIDEVTGLDCLAVRNAVMGHWCGYVGVGPEHRLYRHNYQEVDVMVHGGLTFSDVCQDSDDPAKGVCHRAALGRPEHVWWFGFDCAHFGDLLPGLDHGGQYRSIDYVRHECGSLATQLGGALKARR